MLVSHTGARILADQIGKVNRLPPGNYFGANPDRNHGPAIQFLLNWGEASGTEKYHPLNNNSTSMKTASLLQNLHFNDQKPAISVLLETDFTKDIRIAMRKGQLMKEHKTAFPIVVQVFSGQIDFGVRGEKVVLQAGDMIALEGGVPHDLLAAEESVVRLTLSKRDKAERVEKLV